MDTAKQKAKKKNTKKAYLCFYEEDGSWYLFDDLDNVENMLAHPDKSINGLEVCVDVEDILPIDASKDLVYEISLKAIPYKRSSVTIG